MERKLKDSGIPWIGYIPEEWGITNFKRICRLFNGDSISDGKKDSFNNPIGSIPYISTKDIDLDTHSINYKNGMWVDKTDYSFKRVPANTPLLCIEGGSAGRKIGYTTQEVCFVNKLACFDIIDRDQHSSKFMYYFLQSKGFSTQFSLNISGLIGGVSLSIIRELKIPVPPLAEQVRIAAYLDEKCGEIDELIGIEEQMISDLEAYRQAVITEAVTKGVHQDLAMVPSGCDWFKKHPAHWTTEKIRNLFNRRSEKNSPIKTKERLSLSIDKGVTLYANKTTNLDRFKDDFTQYQLAHPNDIVLNSMNMIVGAVGRSSYYGCVSPVYYVIYGKDSNTNMDYYGYLLNTPIIRDVYHKLGQGIYAIERGDGRVNTCRLKVDYYEFSQIRVPVPPVEEQKEIASYLKEKEQEIDDLIKVKQGKIETLKEYRQSLIFEAVTGKIEIA